MQGYWLAASFVRGVEPQRVCSMSFNISGGFRVEFSLPDWELVCGCCGWGVVVVFELLVGVGVVALGEEEVAECLGALGAVF